MFSFSIFMRNLNKIFQSNIELFYLDKDNLYFCWYFREIERVDREALYCSSALHKMRQNAFHKRLNEHQMRWV